MSLKIDSHQHFWKYDPIRYGWIDESMKEIRRDFSPEDLEPYLIQNDFDGCIAVQADQSEMETDYLLELAGKYDFIKAVVGWVDLSLPDVDEKLNFYSCNPYLKGLRYVVFDEKGEFMIDPAFQEGIAKLPKFGLTYDILSFDYQLPGAIELVRKFPEQPFVLNHIAKPNVSKEPSDQWVRDINSLASSGNVYCKLSGMVTEAENFKWQEDDFYPFLNVVFKAFGPERLMFGSDWPVCLVAASYSDTVRIIGNYLSASSSVVSDIFGGNASRFYNL